MKKLVCEKDIQKLVNEGKKVCYVSEDTLVTPSAKDAARTAGIEISDGEEPKACCCEAFGRTGRRCCSARSGGCPGSCSCLRRACRDQQRYDLSGAQGDGG